MLAGCVIAVTAGRLVLATVGPVIAAPLQEAGMETLVPQALRPGSSVDGHAVDTATARLCDACGSKDVVRTVVKRGNALALASAP